jgi:hypothetical protein
MREFFEFHRNLALVQREIFAISMKSLENLYLRIAALLLGPLRNNPFREGEALQQIHQNLSR